MTNTTNWEQLPTGQTADRQDPSETQAYEATIWEKAEHWRFYVTIQATDKEAAQKEVKKMYPARDYRIIEIR